MCKEIRLLYGLYVHLLIKFSFKENPVILGKLSVISFDEMSSSNNFKLPPPLPFHSKQHSDL